MRRTTVLSAVCVAALAGPVAAFPVRVQDRDPVEIWYRDTHDLAGQTDAHLRALIHLIDQTPYKELVTEANHVLTAAMLVAQALALRHPANDVRAKFHEYDRGWHRLHRRLSELPQWPAGMGKRLDVLRSLNERTHRMLRVQDDRFRDDRYRYER